MLFNSLTFAWFFVLVFAGAWSLRRQGAWRHLFLLAASYLFYANWSPRFLILILWSTGLDYVIGLALERSQRTSRRKLYLLFSLVGNLGVLGFFKYWGFFTAETVALLNSVGFDAHLPTLKIVLPVGISFYTFQTLSYTIDVYRKRMPAEPSLLRFALFVAFFPQLVAGPIVRASRFLPQLRDTPTLSLEQMRSGLALMFWGLTKKVLIADFLGATVVQGFWDAPGTATSGLGAVFAIYAYAFQIYGDFSGYSDMAIGAARLLGYELGDNFRSPYRALNPSDFWQRWHISLSEWLRDYLYIPLGGNRLGTFKTYRNLALTMLLGGLWHGASWMFVLWGAFHGALLIGHRLWCQARGESDPTQLNAVQSTLRRAGFFQLTCLGWILFRSSDWAECKAVLFALGKPTAWGSIGTLQWVVLVSAILVHCLPRPRKVQVRNAFTQIHPALQGALFALLIGLVWNASGLGQPFIYFQF